MPKRSFIVVGAGMGGLATALRLAHEGYRVTVLEKTDQVGGRNRSLSVGACSFDAGPTLMMMREPFDRLFADVGEHIEDHLDIEKLDPSYRVFYRDGSTLEATADRSRMASSIRSRFGQAESEGFCRLLRDLESMYGEAIPNFVRKNYRGPADFFGPGSLASVARHKMLGNFARRIARYVRDPKLQMLFSFQCMYLGLSPFEAPWVYAVLTYMEYGEGIWYPKGGLVRLAQVIDDLASARGADIRLNSPVSRIEGQSAILESGVAISGDAVIVNADLPYAERALLAGPSRRRRHSCSAFVMYLDYAGSLPALLHHNVFFGSDFRLNLEQVLNRCEIPDDPAFYACVSARTDPRKAPSGHENLMLLVPCPNLDRPWSERDAGALRDRVFARLSDEVGFEAGRITAIDGYDPLRYARDLNLDRGAAFGLSHHFRQSAFFRPGNRSRHNPDVYFVGASTVPGNGLPMVLISAELVKERLERDLGLASPVVARLSRQSTV